MMKGSFANPALNDALAAVRGRFLTRLVEQAATLCDAAERLCDGALTRADVERVHYEAHKISGTAGTLGHGQLSQLAAETELAAQGVLKGADPVSLNAPLMALLAEAGQVLEAAHQPGPH